MHLSLILLAVAIAWVTRSVWYRSEADSSSHPTWSDRWQWALSCFLLPPLLLFTTAIAVLWMGMQGEMLGLPVGWIGYLLAIGFLSGSTGLLLRLGWQGWRSLQQVQCYPLVELENSQGHVLESASLFAAQVGFWRSRLVITKGLLTCLTPEQVAAVLTHEQAHAYYRDTFWFFWLGWLRQLTAWLPNTEALWQELLLLRELRADRWAAQTVDPLVLAESLLQVVQDSCTLFPSAAFSAAAPLSRLEERIDALLVSPETSALEGAEWLGGWAVLGMLSGIFPLFTLLLHHS